MVTSSLDKALTIISYEVVTCVIGDETFKKFIPQEHCGQVLQQAVVLCVDYVIYVLSSETDLLYICVVQVPANVRDVCLLVMLESLGVVIGWAHSSPRNIPPEADTKEHCVLSERLPFWNNGQELSEGNGSVSSSKAVLNTEHKIFFPRRKKTLAEQLNTVHYCALQ